MPDYGVTDSGFSLKRLADILTDMKAKLETVQDPVTGEALTPDLADENDPLVQIVNAFSDALSVGWEQLELTYNQFDPLKATGPGLSSLVQINSLRRKAGTYSVVVLTLKGKANSEMPSGKQVATLDDSVVFTLPAVDFDALGDATVAGIATEKGPLTALAGTVVKIVTPTAGWTFVTNLADAVPGTAVETDKELRARQRDSTSATGKSLIESIYSGLAGLADVTYCRVYQNITNAVDANGLPAKSIAPVIVGGDDDEIADELFQKVPAGAETYGTTTVNKVDAQGFTYPMEFSRPATIAVFVAISVKVINSSLWGSDGEDRVKAAIIAYAEQGADALGIPTGYDQDGYAPGQSVYASELYTPVNSVLGIQILSLDIGTADPAAAQEIAIAWNEIASFGSGDISIVVS